MISGVDPNPGGLSADELAGLLAACDLAEQAAPGSEPALVVECGVLRRLVRAARTSPDAPQGPVSVPGDGSGVGVPRMVERP